MKGGNGEGSAVIVGRLNGLYSDALWTASAFEGSGLGGEVYNIESWGCFDREEIVGWVGELAPEVTYHVLMESLSLKKKR